MRTTTLLAVPLLSLAAANVLPRDATPVAEAAPAVSTAASTLSYTVFFASQQCQFTSSSATISPAQCANLTQDTGNASYRLTGFVRGNDYPGDGCSVQVFANTNCAGTPVSTQAANPAGGACTVETGAVSVKLVC